MNVPYREYRADAALIVTENEPLNSSEVSWAMENVLVNFNLSAHAHQELEHARAGKQVDLDYISGTIEILAADTLILVGAFDSAILLLPTLDSLARAMREFRNAGTALCVTVVGDAVDLWLLRRQGILSPMTLAYRDQRTPPMQTGSFDTALMEAAATLLTTVRDGVPPRLWTAGSEEARAEITLTWPSLERIWAKKLIPL